MSDTPTKRYRLVYSTSEVAELLGIGRSTVFELIHSHQLPSFKIGSRRLVICSDLTNFVERQRGKAA